MRSEQTAIASGQRSTKRQPATGSTAPYCERRTGTLSSRSAGTRIRDRREEEARVRVQRILQHRFDRPLLDDLPGVHHEHLVGDVASTREIVRDVEEGEITLLLQRQHQVQDPDPDRDVEHRGRLVGQDHARLDGKGPCDRDSLPLPARELVRVLRGVLVGGTRPTVESSSCTRAGDGVRRHDADGSSAAARCGARWSSPGSASRTDPGRSSAPASGSGGSPCAGSPASRRRLRRGRRPRSGRTAARASARPCSCRCRSRRRAR